jgi:hypothetical protein
MRTLLLGVLLLFGSHAVMSGAHRDACVQSASMNAQSLFSHSVLTIIKAAQSALNIQLEQNHSVAFYYACYEDGALTIQYLGSNGEGDWYQLAYGGGDMIICIEEDL